MVVFHEASWQPWSVHTIMALAHTLGASLSELGVLSAHAAAVNTNAYNRHTCALHTRISGSIQNFTNAPICCNPSLNTESKFHSSCVGDVLAQFVSFQGSGCSGVCRVLVFPEVHTHMQRFGDWDGSESDADVGLDNSNDSTPQPQPIEVSDDLDPFPEDMPEESAQQVPHIPDVPADDTAEVSDSGSDVWTSRRGTTRKKSKPLTPAQQTQRVCANLANALSGLLKLPGAPSDQSPSTAVQAGEQQPAQHHGATRPEAGDLPEALLDLPLDLTAKRTRAIRGTAGTFAGRRPPKCPSKLHLFEAQRAEYTKAKEAARKDNPTAPTMKQKDYWKFLQQQMKNSRAEQEQVPQKERLKKAVATYREGIVMKRPAAAPSSASLATPIKKTAKADTVDDLTPEKVVEHATAAEVTENEK